LDHEEHEEHEGKRKRAAIELRTVKRIFDFKRDKAKWLSKEFFFFVSFVFFVVQSFDS
jgi:hypothetical protein